MTEFALPELLAYPALFFANFARLKECLRARSVDHGLDPDGVTLYIDIGEIVDYVIDVH